MRFADRIALATLATGLLMSLACGVGAFPMYQTGFEPSINADEWAIGPSSWWVSTWAHEELKGDDSHIRTPGINSARAWVNYHVTYNSQHPLGAVFSDGCYYKCWMFEDNDVAFQGYNSEYQPNSIMAVLGADTGEYFGIGVMGATGIGQATKRWFTNIAVETAMDGKVALDGTLGTVATPRRQGWRKYTILVNGYTETAGDVQFLVDDKVVYNGQRSLALPPLPGGAEVDTMVLGLKSVWTFETYWFDQVDYGLVETAQPCATTAEAKALPDGAWVQLDPKVVTGKFVKSPWPGYFAIEDDDRSGGLWVSSSYDANVATATHEAEQVSVKGIMCTNEAGMRYLDAIQVTSAQTLAPQPRILGTALSGLDTPSMDGKLVKVWGKVINVPGSDPASPKGQERRGDWRRFFVIDDGSPTGPMKCYYDNIISGTNPVPDVRTGDYVSVVGVYGKEVLVPSAATPAASAQKSIWIRKAGDLIIVRPS